MQFLPPSVPVDPHLFQKIANGTDVGPWRQYDRLFYGPTISSTGRKRPIRITDFTNDLIEKIMHDELERLRHMALTEGWASLSITIAAMAHTCRRFRAALLPHIYRRLYVFKLTTLIRIHGVLACDPKQAVARSIKHLYWDWNSCGVFSFLWGLPGAFGSRRYLHTLIDKGYYRTVPRFPETVALPAKRSDPTAWPSNSCIPTRPLRSTDDTGVDGDKDSEFDIPEDVLDVLRAVVNGLVGLEEVTWNAAALPMPPCLFNYLPRKDQLKTLSVFNEHNCASPLASAFECIPDSIETLRICHHSEPSLNIARDDIVDARRDAMRLYLWSLGLSAKIGDTKTLEEVLEHLVPDEQSRAVDVVFPWPLTAKSSGAASTRAECAAKAPDSTKEQDKSGSNLPQASDGPASASKNAELNDTDSSARPQTQPLPFPSSTLPWPWSAATGPTSTRQASQRVLATRIVQLLEGGNLKELAVCGSSFLHEAEEEERKQGEGDGGSPSLEPGPGIFLWPDYVHLWGTFKLPDIVCHRDYTRAFGQTSLYGVLDQLVMPFEHRQGWLSAVLLHYQLDTMVSAYAHERRALGTWYPLNPGQAISITGKDLIFLIEHYGWQPRVSGETSWPPRGYKDEEFFRLAMEHRSESVCIRWHEKGISDDSSQEVAPLLGKYQLPILSSPVVCERIAKAWSEEQQKQTAEWRADLPDSWDNFKDWRSAGGTSLDQHCDPELPFAASVWIALENALQGFGPGMQVKHQEVDKHIQGGTADSPSYRPQPVRMSLYGACPCPRCEEVPGAVAFAGVDEEEGSKSGGGGGGGGDTGAVARHRPEIPQRVDFQSMLKGFQSGNAKGTGTGQRQTAKFVNIRKGSATQSLQTVLEDAARLKGERAAQTARTARAPAKTKEEREAESQAAAKALLEEEEAAAAAAAAKQQQQQQAKGNSKKKQGKKKGR